MSPAKRLIADLGSCWGKKEADIKVALKMLAESGVKWVKVQLCARSHGNKPFPPILLGFYQGYAKSLGMNLSTSIWDVEGLEFAIEAKCTWIKLAWSSPRILLPHVIDRFDEVVVTCRANDKPWPPSRKYTKLWLVTDNGVPEYPAHPLSPGQHTGKYIATGGPYDGFSCHSPDWHQAVLAFEAGATTVEVHANPLAIQGPPDSQFALTCADIEKITRGLE